MLSRLYSLCWMSDGVHWLLLEANGGILGVSPCGFDTEANALIDLRYR